MHETLTTLDSSTVDALVGLKSDITFASDNIRIGENGLAKLSVYNYSKWYNWSREQRETYKDLLSDYVDTAIVGWFISFPANTGFLDNMTYWKDKSDSGTVVAFSLTNNNTIKIAGNTITVNKGEGIRFSLRQVHEVELASFERNWACLMQLQ